MTGFFDSHAHYTDDRFQKEHPGGVESLLRELYDNGVSYIMNVAVNLEDASACLRLAEKIPDMCVSAGIFPSDTRFCNDPEQEMLALSALLKHPSVRAVGEIGLDYHYPDTDRDRQKDYLRRQLALAEREDLPVIFHDRDAHGDSMEMISEVPRVRGVFHCFSGSKEMARELLARGWYLSFTGVITYDNARRACETLRFVPDDRLLIETDAPYLAPVPYRGGLNRSDYLRYTAERMAQLRGQTVEHITRITAENAKKLFGIRERS